MRVLSFYKTKESIKRSKKGQKNAKRTCKTNYEQADKEMFCIFYYYCGWLHIGAYNGKYIQPSKIMGKTRGY